MSHIEPARSPDESGGAYEADAELLKHLRGGHERAWESLVRECSGRMLAGARRILQSEDEARNAVQAAFVQAFRSIGGFRGGSRLSTWLYRITINESLMRLRSSSRRPEVPIEELLPAFHENGPHAETVQPWPAPDQVLLQEETCSHVRECIGKLPLDYRVVLMLRDIEELDTAEVADILELTPNAVRIRLHRARMALRTLLTPWMTTIPGGPGLAQRPSADS